MNKTLISTIGLFLVAHWSFADDFQIQKRRVPDSLPRIQTETWQTQKTAVIVCDMWDAHHCLNAVKRVKEMAPRMNRLLEQMRNGGATIIHAPSSCVNFYENHPARINVSKIPRSKNIPEGIGQWCDHIPSEKHYPLDQS
ncbi:MAG: nicotinamidase, partial [Planctomycetota bacterium]|nr:nicotinamidase [Planctomycetota bacterium]